MQKLFTKILVPVTFGRNAHWILEKAIQLANKFDCDILLLHVGKPASVIPFFRKTFFSRSPATRERNDPETRVREMELLHRPKLKEGLIMSSVAYVGQWQAVVKDVIIAEHIDLTLIPQCRKKWGSAVIRHININKLSQQTSCPVMTVTRNFNANHLHNIVVPVFDLLPVKKLTMASYLSIETSACIYLMGRTDSTAAKAGKGYLMKAYQLLNDFGKLNIQCALQENEDRAGSTLAYAKNIKANLIVVNPGNESRLKGLWNTLQGKYLSRESDIPVLTVAF